MTNVIYIYFIINAFIAGYTYKDTYSWETKLTSISYTFFALLVGIPFYIILFIINASAPILGWTHIEIKFQYRFHFTKYWDKILLDDNYSPIYKTLEDKLERAEKLTRGSSKQVRRHNKKVKNRYEKL
jgi:hypothetical protein